MNSITPNPSPSQQSTVTNWKEIDLSTPEGLRALDRYIASLAGWTCKLEGKLGYYLRSPAGSVYQITPVTWCDTPEETIAHIWQNGYIPKYSTDTNAALSLWEMVGGLTVSTGHTRPGFPTFNIHAEYWGNVYGEPYSARNLTHTQLALHIACAWLNQTEQKTLHEADRIAKLANGSPQADDAKGGQS